MMRLAAGLHEDPTPVGFMCSANMCGMSVGGKHSVCVLSHIPNWVSRENPCSGDLPPSTHNSFLLVESRFQGFAQCFGPVQAFSTQVIGVVSHSFGSGAVPHKAASAAVIFKWWEWEWCLGRGAEELGRGERVWLTGWGPVQGGGKEHDPFRIRIMGFSLLCVGI